MNTDILDREDIKEYLSRDDYYRVLAFKIKNIEEGCDVLEYVKKTYKYEDYKEAIANFIEYFICMKYAFGHSEFATNDTSNLYFAGSYDDKIIASFVYDGNPLIDIEFSEDQLISPEYIKHKVSEMDNMMERLSFGWEDEEFKVAIYMANATNDDKNWLKFYKAQGKFVDFIEDVNNKEIIEEIKEKVLYK